MMMKYRVHEVAKDLEVANKEVLDILGKYVKEPKKHMTALEENELNIVFDKFTQDHAVENFDAYFAARSKAQEAPAADPAPAAQPQPAQKGQQKPQGDRKPQQNGKPADGKKRPNQPGDRNANRNQKNDRKPNNQPAPQQKPAAPAPVSFSPAPSTPPTQATRWCCWPTPTPAMRRWWMTTA